MNALLLLAPLAAVGGAYAVGAYGPRSFRARMARDLAEGLARRAPQPAITEADLAPLPRPVQRYLRFAGVVGRPRVQAARFRFRGGLRGGPDEPWMRIVADQVSFFDQRTRLFHVRARRAGVPFEAYHRFVGPSAIFTVKLLSLFTITDARGPEMDRSETVTFLNDMALLAPATLVSPALRWEPVDDRAARVTFTEGGQSVRAELRFDAEGRLADFVSDDRAQAAKDGRSFRAARWSTPIREYRTFGPHRLPGVAGASWSVPEGAYEYARFEVDRVDYDPSA
ncbi:MAG TPA: DUF6544 family protein [Anaeromyxobacter sp.]|nr:DUF6544 family protein [Anaeromyxobacter sp.]